MTGRLRLDVLPTIPNKHETISPRIRGVFETLKLKFEKHEDLGLAQRGWLAEYDDKHGDGLLKGQLFEEVTKTVETSRRIYELQAPQPANPAAESQRAEGLRADRTLAILVEGQKEATRLVKTALDKVQERQERLDQWAQQLFEDQRQLLQLAFTQNGALSQHQIAALESLREGIEAQAESEVAVKSAEMELKLHTQAAENAKQHEGGKLRGKMEDMILGGIAAKLGIPPEIFIDNKNPVQEPPKQE